MARSMRSKRGRKLRAAKRVRYGEKELLRLKNMLAKATEEEEESRLRNMLMQAVTEQSMSNAAVTEQSPEENIVSESPLNDVEMDDDSKKAEPSNKQQQLPSKSKYPSWLSHFKIKKLAKQERKRKHKEAKRLKKEKKKMSRKNKKK